jgi:drug/metabolite transporter (DMT)-like permease
MNSELRQSSGTLCSLHISVLLFGLAGVVAKTLSLPATFIVFARAVVSALVILPFVAKGTNRSLPTVKDLSFHFITAALLATHWLTFFYAIQISSLAIGLVSFSAYPIFTTLIEPYCTRSRISLRNIIVVFMLICGLSIANPSINFSDSATRGLIIGTLSGLLFALLSVANKLRSDTLSPLSMAMWQNGLAGMLLFPFVFQSSFTVTPKDLLLLLLLGIFCTALAHSLFLYSLKTVSAQFASTATTLEPVYGVALGWVILGDLPNPSVIVGGLIILITIVIETSHASRVQKELRKSGESPLTRYFFRREINRIVE